MLGWSHEVEHYLGHAGEVGHLRSVEVDGINYILSGAVDDRNISGTLTYIVLCDLIIQYVQEVVPP